MRCEPHPVSGFIYREVGECIVRVEDQSTGRYGLFKADGTWLEGEITLADPCMLDLIGAPNVADGWDVYWGLLPPELDDEHPPTHVPGFAKDAVAAGADAPRIIGQYVPDPGKKTELGVRSISDVGHQFLLDNDRHPELVPDVYRLESPAPGGPERVPVDRFFKKEYHDLEVEHLWKKTWQMVCREDDIPEIGDHYVYDIAHLSFLVVRTGENEIKAYYNACLHRGRQLRECSGRKAREFRCPFHGWTWSIDGKLKHITAEWDFPGVREDAGNLPSVKVATWAGFVFINPDPDPNSISLEEYMGPVMIAHYKKLRLENRYKQVHVSKIIPANWKVTMEAFMEAYHVFTAHPQILLTGLDYSDSHYDVFGNFGRLYGNSATSPMRGMYITEEEALERYRAHADFVKSFVRTVIGDEVDEYSDAEISEGSYSNLFPNFSPWGGFIRIVYRWRPHGDNPDECIMEIMLLSPWPKDKPKPPSAPVKHLSIDEPWTNAHQLGTFARIMDQDLVNLPRVQAGLKTKNPPYIWYSSYQEGVIRNWHRLYDEKLGIKRDI